MHGLAAHSTSLLLLCVNDVPMQRLRAHVGRFGCEHTSILFMMEKAVSQSMQRSREEKKIKRRQVVPEASFVFRNVLGLIKIIYKEGDTTLLQF